MVMSCVTWKGHFRGKMFVIMVNVIANTTSQPNFTGIHLKLIK